MKKYSLKFILVLSIVSLSIFILSFSNVKSWSNYSQQSEKSEVSWQKKVDYLFELVREENPEIAQYYDNLDSIKKRIKDFDNHIIENMMFIEEEFVYLDEEYGDDKKHGKYIKEHRKNFLEYSSQLLYRHGKYSYRVDLIEEYQAKFKMISIIPMMDKEAEKIKIQEKQIDEFIQKTKDFEKEGVKLLEKHLNKN